LTYTDYGGTFEAGKTLLWITAGTGTISWS
jgi:hypothetical protein